MNDSKSVKGQPVMESLLERFIILVSDLSEINEQSYSSVNRILDVREPVCEEKLHAGEIRENTVTDRFESVLRRFYAVKAISVQVREGLSRIP